MKDTWRLVVAFLVIVLAIVGVFWGIVQAVDCYHAGGVWLNGSVGYGCLKN